MYKVFFFISSSFIKILYVFPKNAKNKKKPLKKIRSKIPNSSNLYKPAVPFIKRIKGELRNVPHSLDGLSFLTLLP